MTMPPTTLPLSAGDRPIMVALAGAGCSPQIYAQIAHRDLDLVPLDWASWPGPWDLDSLSALLARDLSARASPSLLAGHSLGGVIALLTALKAPDAVAGLLLADTGAGTSGHGDPDLPARVRAGWTAEDRQAFLRSCFRRLPPSEVWLPAIAYLAALDSEIFLQAVASLRQIDLRERLVEIRVPTVVVRGLHDPRRTRAHALELAQGIAGAELIEPDTGHTPMVEDPAAFNDAVERLWAAVRRAGGHRPPGNCQDL